MTPATSFLLGAAIGLVILLSLMAGWRAQAVLERQPVNWWRFHQWADRQFKSFVAWMRKRRWL